MTSAAADEPGNSHARHTDPITSKIAGRSNFTPKRDRACLLIALFDTEAGMTRQGLQRITDRPDIQRLLRSEEPLGTCVWHRVTDCMAKGWVESLRDDNGVVVNRLETNGKPQQVFRITQLGRQKAREMAAALRAR